jgi:short-subunit dehydrogenase
LDLQNPESFETYKKLLAEEKPEVALLANIAGYGKFGKYDEISLEDCLGMIDLNCKALVAMSQLTIPYMKRGSKILQLDSLSAFQPVPYLNVYGSSKSFVLSYSRALNRELKTKGIRVMSVNPGWVKTEFFDHATKSSNDAITYFNVMYDAKDVIKTAIRDLYHTKKDVSIHGFQIKAQVLLVKLLPHKIVMEIWMRQQKHK